MRYIRNCKRVQKFPDFGLRVGGSKSQRLKIFVTFDLNKVPPTQLSPEKVLAGAT